MAEETVKTFQSHTTSFGTRLQTTSIQLHGRKNCFHHYRIDHPGQKRVVASEASALLNLKQTSSGCCRPRVQSPRTYPPRLLGLGAVITSVKPTYPFSPYYSSLSTSRRTPSTRPSLFTSSFPTRRRYRHQPLVQFIILLRHS